MKKFILSFALLAVALTVFSSFSMRPDSGSHRRSTLYGVAFYNVENLFDTLHDAGKDDYEFLPDGKNKWGREKYEAKLHNIAKVLSELCMDKVPEGPAVIGLSEIENQRVLTDLLKQPALATRGYHYVTFPGVDRRGVECSFLYNPRLFQFEHAMVVPYYYSLSGDVQDPLVGFYTDNSGRVCAYEDLKGDTTYITRGFLVMEGFLAGEKLFFIVNHWPSRGAGDEARRRAGFQLRKLTDALMRQAPGAKVVVMGDMNDDPADKSMTEQLGCVSEPKKVRSERDFYNPWYNTLYKEGRGTLLYKGKWNLFDQIVVSGNLVGKKRDSLKFYEHAIFMRDYLIQQDGKYKGSPLRTQAGGMWLNGYSDHLPTQIYLVKKTK